MSSKQPYLDESDLNNIRDLVNELTRNGLYYTLRSHAVKNVNERLDNHSPGKPAYMTPEQAWATAVVYLLISHGYEIKKKDDKWKDEAIEAAKELAVYHAEGSPERDRHGDWEQTGPICNKSKEWLKRWGKKE